MSPVHQCTNDWRALRVGIISASKVPALLRFCEIKEFDSAWFALRNNIDESILNRRRSKLPNFIRGKMLLPSLLKTLASTSVSVDTSNTPGIKGLVQVWME